MRLLRGLGFVVLGLLIAAVGVRVVLPPAVAQNVGIVYQPVYPTVLVQTNATITATTTSADITVPPGVRSVACFLTVTGTVSGTTPTLNCAVKLKDPQGQAQYVAPNALVSANCTATACIQEIMVGPAVQNTANVSAAGILGSIVQVVLTAGGTTPSFGGTYVTLLWN